MRFLYYDPFREQWGFVPEGVEAWLFAGDPETVCGEKVRTAAAPAGTRLSCPRPAGPIDVGFALSFGEGKAIDPAQGEVVAREQGKRLVPVPARWSSAHGRFLSSRADPAVFVGHDPPPNTPFGREDSPLDILLPAQVVFFAFGDLSSGTRVRVDPSWVKVCGEAPSLLDPPDPRAGFFYVHYGPLEGLGPTVRFEVRGDDGAPKRGRFTLVLTGPDKAEKRVAGEDGVAVTRDLAPGKYFVTLDLKAGEGKTSGEEELKRFHFKVALPQGKDKYDVQRHQALAAQEGDPAGEYLPLRREAVGPAEPLAEFIAGKKDAPLLFGITSGAELWLDLADEQGRPFSGEVILTDPGGHEIRAQAVDGKVRRDDVPPGKYLVRVGAVTAAAPGDKGALSVTLTDGAGKPAAGPLALFVPDGSLAGELAASDGRARRLDLPPGKYVLAAKD